MSLRAGEIVRSRWAALLGAWVGYALAFFPLYQLVGETAVVLGLVPASLTGALLGTWPGGLAGVVAFLVNLLLLATVGASNWSIMLHGGLLGSIFVVAVAAAMGRMRDLTEQMKQEIAERARMEQALRESEERYRSLVAHQGEGIAIANADDVFTFANPAADRLFGVEQGGLAGHSMREFLDEAGWARVQAETRARARGEKATYELQITRPDGEERVLLLTAVPHLDASGAFSGGLGVFRDITERKRAEEKLAEERERLRFLMEATRTHFNVLDASFNLHDVDPAWRRIYGDPQGHTCYEYFMERDSPCPGCGAREALETREIVISEQFLPKENRVFEVHTVPFQDDQGAWHVAEFKIDITDRKRAEEQLEEYAEELEQANQEVRQFAYIVSHDLRAPLVSLKGFSAELRFSLDEIRSISSSVLPHLDERERQRWQRTLDEDVPEALGFIESSVTRMDAFINAVLTLSRLGRRQLSLEPIDMESLVQSVLDSLAHQIEACCVNVSVGPLPDVVADRTSMEQIVGNLLDNALKYLEPGRPGKIVVDGAAGREAFTFRIRDNGRGIAPDDLDKIYIPFRRAGPQEVPGDGMGLPYVQTLLRRHGGSISCESQPGQGTVFAFTISNHLTGGETID